MNRIATDIPGQSVDNGPQPLYRRVYEYLVANIGRSTWKVGELLPNEQLLAGELGVSVGTVRKALDMLAVTGLIERRQGKGTFVAETTLERSQFRFFRFADLRGHRASPSSSGDSIVKREPEVAEAAGLRLLQNDLVFEINRIRLLNGKPASLERIVIPVKLFPNIDRFHPIPNALYCEYQRTYGIHIVRAEERITAIIANPQDASRLGIKPGTALLNVKRVAISVTGEPIELRTQRCDTRDFHYAISLT